MAPPWCAEIRKTCFSRDVYEPSDDSFALCDAMAAHLQACTGPLPRTCLEIGCGSGYVICSAARLLRLLGSQSLCLLATDCSSAALEATAGTLQAHEITGVDLVRTDLLSGLEDRLNNSVDMLLFNPPYVPTPDEEVALGTTVVATWAGGWKGRRVIDRLLPLLPTILSPSGRLFMVTVAANEPEEIVKDLRSVGFQAEVALVRAADEERLSIVHAWRNGASELGAE